MSFTKFDIDINLNFFIFFILFTSNIISFSIITYVCNTTNTLSTNAYIYYIFLNLFPSILADFIYLMTTIVCTLEETIYIYSSVSSFLSLNFYLLIYNITISFLLQSYLLVYLELFRFGVKIFILDHYSSKIIN